MMEGQQVSAFRQVDENRIRGTFGTVILGQLQTKPSGLHPDGRIQLRIEIGGTMKNLSCYFVFFDRHAGMRQSVRRQIAKKLTQRLGAMQDMTACQPVNLLQVLVPIRQMGPIYSHVTLQ
jgi:hypothetical protein